MFNNQPYLSKGVDSRVSQFVQMLLWDMIDDGKHSTMILASEY